MPTAGPATQLSKLLRSDAKDVAKELLAHCIESSEAHAPALPPEPLSEANALLEQYIINKLKEKDITTLRCIVAGGLDERQFAREVAHFERAPRCGRVWEPQTIAYRCKTCAKNQCMSLCSDCFKAADHTGHDYNRFWSLSGGACDCGNASVMDEKGFCSRHGPRVQQLVAPAPVHLTAPAQYVLPYVCLHMLQTWRGHYVTMVNTKSEREIGNAFDTFYPLCHEAVTLLKDCAEMGGPLRTQLAKIMTDTELFERMEARSSELQNGARARKAVLDSLPPISTLATNIDERTLAFLSDGCPMLTVQPTYTCVLDECMLWLVCFEFPQSFVTFVLSMLSHDLYRAELAHTFFAHYSRTCTQVTRLSPRQPLNENETLCSRVVHISVQILSGDSDVQRLMEPVTDGQPPVPLGRLLVACLRCMIDRTAKTPSWLPDDPTRPRCTCVPPPLTLTREADDQTIEQRHYWSVVLDLHNVLSHRVTTLQFLNDTEYSLPNYCKLIALLQGMAMSERIVSGPHVEFEPHNYYAYSAEIELSAMCMWALSQVVEQSDDEMRLQLCHIVLRKFSATLGRWFDAIGMDEVEMQNFSRLHFSFHLPLHRHIAIFAAILAKSGQMRSIEELLDYESSCACGYNKATEDISSRRQRFLKQLLVHPLALQVCRTEVQCGMWVRNGQALVYHSILYAQCTYCRAFVDADNFLLQIIATFINDVDWLVYTLLDRFRVNRCLLTPSPAGVVYAQPDMRDEWTTALIEAFLKCVATLVDSRTFNGHDEEARLRAELVTAICCASDGTRFSKLRDSLPLCGRDNIPDSVIGEALQHVATLIDGDEVPLYKATAQTWLNEFDPLHALMRTQRPGSAAAAMLKYSAVARAYATGNEHIAEVVAKDSKSANDDTDVWPPWKVPMHKSHLEIDRLMRLTSNRVLHAALYIFIAKACDADELEACSVSSTALSLCVHLIRTALQRRVTVDRTTTKAQRPSTVSYLALLYDTDDILINAAKVVDGACEEMLPEDTRIGLDVMRPLFGKSLVHLLMQLFAHYASKRHLEKNRLSEWRPDKQVYYAELPVIPPDPAFYVGRVLQQMYDESPNCRQLIESLRKPPEPIKPTSTVGEVSSATGSMEGLSEKERQRLLIKQKQAAMLERMKRQQKNVLKNLIDVEASRIRTDSSTVESETARQIVERALSDDHDEDDDSRMHCVICTHKAHSTHENPMGLLVMLHPNNVLAHCQPENAANYDVEAAAHQADEEKRAQIDDRPATSTALNIKLPEIEHCPRMTRSIIDDVVYDALKSDVDNDPIMMVTLSSTQSQSNAPSSVRARTCSHYAHISCHERFMDSRLSMMLRAFSSEEALMPRLGEFYCPLCRRRCNAILPVAPRESMGASVDVAVPVPSNDGEMQSNLLSIEQAVVAVQRALNRLLIGPLEFADSAYTSACEQYLEQVRHSVQYTLLMSGTARLGRSNVEQHLVEYLLAPHLLRANIELDIMLHDASLLRPQDLLRSVVGPMMPVLATRYVRDTNTRRLVMRDCDHEWTHLADVEGAVRATGDSLLNYRHSPFYGITSVALLLRDPISLFNRYMLVLLYGHNLVDERDKQQTKMFALCVYTCLLRMQLTRACVHLLFVCNDQQREQWFAYRRGGTTSTGYYDPELLNFFSMVCNCASTIGLCAPRLVSAAKEALSTELGEQLPHAKSREMSDEFICELIHRACLPLARYVCLFMHHTQLAPIADLSVLDDFQSAHRHLLRDSPLMHRGTTELLPWGVQALHETLDVQLNLLAAQLTRRTQCIQSILFSTGLIQYRPASLVKLPLEFDVLFELYNGRACAFCAKAPKQCLVCLQCGKMLCFQDNCCKASNGNTEPEQHVSYCSIGVGVFLCVQTSMVLIARGLRGALWGSLYIDEHGEEDPGLRRGRPMRLSSARYQRLEREWRQQDLGKNDAGSSLHWQPMQNYLSDLGRRVPF